MGLPGIYARVLRVVAIVIAVVIIGRQLIAALPDPRVADRLLILRAAGAGLLIALGLSCSPRVPAARLRVLAFLIGLVTALVTLGVMIISPELIWEQVTALVAVILGAAVFMPWSWRWQASFVGVVLLGTALTFLAVLPSSSPALSGGSAARLVITLVALAGASVIGTELADRARRQLAASEARYRGLFERAADGIAVIDHDGIIREANPRLADLLGRSLSEVLGARLRDFYAADHVATTGGGAIMNEHLAVLAGHMRSAARSLVRPDGQRVEVEIAFSKVVSPDGAVVEAIVRDRTERRAREKRQVQEQRLDSMARLAGGLAHQFNNILGGILTHTTLLRDEVTQPQARAAAEEVLAAARRGRELTRDVLGFTHQEPVTLRPTPPAQIIERVAALARAALPADVTVQTDAPPDLPDALADVDHVVHACQQLVFNARDAMGGGRGGEGGGGGGGRGGGTLTLSAAEQRVIDTDPRWPAAAPGRYVRLSIQDTGVGMDAATLDRVFDPFYSTKPLHEATGLGLTGAQQIALAHRGAIGIESTPGRGTIVHLLLPATDAPVASLTPPPSLPAATAALPVPPPLTPGPGATILIVDDEPIVRSSLRRALTRMGYRVLEAGDGSSALAAVQEAQPPVQLVILDLVLPGGGAAIFELLTAVRPELKVLVSSGYTPDTEAAQGLAARAHGFLPKPYEMNELRDAVAKTLAS